MTPQPPVDATDLAQFDEDYAAAEVQPNQFDEVPDGKYQAKVEKVELVRTQNGAPMLKWHLRVLGPQHRGRMMFRNNVMASSENIKFLKADLLVCGLELGKLSDLPERDVNAGPTTTPAEWAVALLARVKEAKEKEESN